jgi:hypothetical protein
MIRLLQRWEVAYGHYADYVRALEQVNSVARERGWAEFTAWAPTTGKANQVVLISDYPDFATYKEQEAAVYSDAEFMRNWRECAQFVVQGSGYIEVFEPAPQLA